MQMLLMLLFAAVAAVGEVVSVYGMEVTLKVCDAYNEVARIKEELVLLPREMQAHLQYWSAVIDKQERLINILLPSAAAAMSTADVVQQLHAGGMQVGTVHHCATLNDSCHRLPCLRAAGCILWAGMSYLLGGTVHTC